MSTPTPAGHVAEESKFASYVSIAMLLAVITGVEIAVIGLPSPRWGEEPVGVVRLAAGASLDPADLEAYGRRHLASFKVPRQWFAVEVFPLTASGKVKKYELRDALLRTDDL